LLVAGLLALAATPAAALGANFTWTGASSSPNWSDAANWGGTAPSGTVGTLSFPLLPAGACNTSTCYTATNDVSGLDATALSFNAFAQYHVSGNGLTLEGGGISTAASGVAFQQQGIGPAFDLPITFGAPQTWSIHGQTTMHVSGEGGLTLGGKLTGSGESLTATVGDGVVLGFGEPATGGPAPPPHPVDDEVGAVAVTGADTTQSGTAAQQNGFINVEGKLDATDGNSVTLTDIALDGSGSLGPLTSKGAFLQAEAGRAPAGSPTFSVAGPVALDSATWTMFTLGGTTVGSGYAQLAGTTIDLGGAQLLLGISAACPDLSVGTVYPIVSASSSLTGRFANAPNDGSVTTFSSSGSCTEQATVRINYTAKQVTATVTSVSGAPTVPVNQTPPTITGTARQDQTLTYHRGIWSNNPTSYSWSWTRCDTTGTKCQEIAGANDQPTYTLVQADVGHRIRVDEIASNASGSGADASSAPTAIVAPGVPHNLTPPSIIPAPTEGQQVAATGDAWTNNPTSRGYQWLQCDINGNGCGPIDGATGQSYAVASADICHELRVQETARNAVGDSAPVISGATIPSQAASNDFTWRGDPSGSGSFSTATDWAGCKAPSGSVGTVTLPATQCATGMCAAVDDVEGLTASALELLAPSNGSSWSVVGTSPLGVGTSLTTSASSTASPGAVSLSVPVRLEGANTWSIGAPTILDDDLSGSQPLSISTSSPAGLELNGTSNEVGPVTIDGGSVGIGLRQQPGDLNATDGDPVTVQNGATLYGAGSTGPLNLSSQASLSPSGHVSVHGDLSIDGNASVNVPDLAAASPQIDVSGHATLSQAKLMLPPDYCKLGVGSSFTVIQATGGVTGKFTSVNGYGVSPGGTVYFPYITICPNGAEVPQLQIAYTDDAVTVSVPLEQPLSACTATGTPNVMIRGIEVTQGIQTNQFPDTGEGCYFAPGFDGLHPGSMYPGDGEYNSDGSAAYVALVAGRTTVVNVYAGASGQAGSAIYTGPVELRLRGYWYNRNAPVSLGLPLEPDNGAQGVPRETGPVSFADRLDPGKSFQFTLPPDWTEHGTLTLVAEVNPPASTPTASECSACQVDNVFSLGDIDFVNTRPIDVQTAYVRDQSNPNESIPGNAFSGVADLLPASDQGLTLPTAPITNLTVSDVCSPGNADAFSALAGVATGFPPIAGAVNRLVGIEGGLAKNPDGSGCEGGATDYPPTPPPVQPYGYYGLPSNPHSVAVAIAPRTSVAHEIIHGLGLQHAGNNCPGKNSPQEGSHWPSPDQGFLMGIGTDVYGSARVYNPAQAGFATAHPIIAPASPDAPASSQIYDLMSYCVTNLTPGWQSSFATNLAAAQEWQHEVWVSPLTWDLLVDKLASSEQGPGPTLGGPASRDTSAAGGIPTLHVTAVGGTTGLSISSIAPGPVLGAPASGDSGYTLVASDAAGNKLASVQMAAVTIHVEHQPSIPELQADIPASAAARSVEVVSPSGAVVAQRNRPSPTPSVTVLTPRSHARVGCARGHCSVRLAWRTPNPARAPLTTWIDYSPDGGRTWHTVFVGTRTSSARIPARLLSRSSHARIRVRVNDGFDEVDAASRAFRSLGAPPAIQVLSPTAGERLADDATINLICQARDDGGRSLLGRSVRWYDGSTPIGVGAELTATGLPPGTRHITVVARDRFGRTSSATVLIKLKAEPPQLLALRAPARIGAHARRVVLHVASSVPGTVTIRTARERPVLRSIGRHLSAIVVAVKPGRRPLRLTLRLVAYGRADRTAITILRRGAKRSPATSKSAR
jgi:hypothetical protein